MKSTICIGSSCHLKGSRQIVEQLQLPCAENNLKDKGGTQRTFVWEIVSLASCNGR